jgi:hypothetical protein
MMLAVLISSLSITYTSRFPIGLILLFALTSAIALISNPSLSFYGLCIFIYLLFDTLYNQYIPLFYHFYRFYPLLFFMQCSCREKISEGIFNTYSNNIQLHMN